MNQNKESASYLAETRAVVTSPAMLAWLTTLDHKRLGLLYLVATSLALLAAGVLSVALRQDLASSTLVAFLVLVPSLPATLGNFLLPLELGQRRAASPYLALAGFWLYVLGAVVVLAAIGVTQGGTAVEAGLTPMVVGALVLGVSATLNAVNLLATLGQALARGVPSSRISLFAWSLGTTSLAQALSAVGLGGVLILLLASKLHLPPAFPSYAPPDIGARLLAQPWAYLSPASLLMLAPAVGIVSDIVATFARRRSAGYGFVATSSTAIAFLALVAWGAPLLGGGDGEHTALQFGLATALLAVPLAVVVFSSVATLQGGRISLEVPMLWALGFLVHISVGALAGLLLGVPPSSVSLHGTIFEVGYRDYLLTAGSCLGFVAGVYYAWPKITGRLYDSRVGTLAFLLVFVGVQVAFASEMVSALLPEAGALANLPRYGSWVIAAGGLVAFVNLGLSLRTGARAGDNPWGAAGLAWTSASPPPLDNFLEAPDGGVEEGPGSGRRPSPAASTLSL